MRGEFLSRLSKNVTFQVDEAITSGLIRRIDSPGKHRYSPSTIESQSAIFARYCSTCPVCIPWHIFDFGASVQKRSASLCAPLFVLAFCAGAALTGCNNVSLGNSSTFTAISAPASTLRVNQTMQLITNPQFNGIPLVFAVNGIAGGNDQVGTIDAKGLYTAPAIVPVPNTVTITDTAAEYPNFPPGTVKLGVLNPIPILNAITPSGFSEGTETIIVNGSEFVYGAQIIWNGAAAPTTFVAGNQLVAEVAAPKPGTFPLLVSNPNPGAANSKTVSVVVGPGQVVLTPQPEEGTDVRVTNSLNIGLEVNGTLNTGVTLQVNGVPGGNATVGTAVFPPGPRRAQGRHGRCS